MGGEKHIILKKNNQMIKIALIGAGGKMGCRLTDNFLKCPHYLVQYIEISEKGVLNLKDRNLEPG
jgi:D-apionate oxidoisomerase